MNKRIFSIIVPVYNAEKTLERMLASFISSKEYIDEVILVNDQSTDNTFKDDICNIDYFRNFYNIKILDNCYGKGVGSARKTGIINSKSEWITFVDADDCLTPSSLYYVYNKIISDRKNVLLHSKTIYYEYGKFNSKSIGYSDNSCGGNFYKRSYLVKNKLYPHDTLCMAEDEYFNDKIDKFIKYCDIFKHNIVYFDYPVYEVHHDTNCGLSFALRNWADYCCKYHLLYKEYLTCDFIKNKKINDLLLYEYMDNFIFCYFLSQGLLIDKDVDFDLLLYKKYFKRALDYFKTTFNKTDEYLINYFYSNRDNANTLLSGAFSSIGFEFNISVNFDVFVKTI